MTDRNDDHDEMSPEMQALSRWQPPEPITVTLPDLDAILGGVQIQPWLLEYARTRPGDMVGDLGYDPVACATAIGRLARLWSPEDRLQARKLCDDFIAGLPGLSDRCKAWACSLNAEQLGYILRCALNHTDRLYEKLHRVCDVRTGKAKASADDDFRAWLTRNLAEMRDDQESLLWVLEAAQADDVGLLRSSLRFFDEEAERHRALIESLPWPDDDLLAEIAVSEPIRWWGYIEGDRHVWGWDDLVQQDKEEEDA